MSGIVEGRAEWKRKLKEAGEGVSQIEHGTSPTTTWSYYAGSDDYFGEGISDTSFARLTTPETIQESIIERQKRGKKSVVLDVFGQGCIGFDSGADVVLASTYRDPNDTFHRGGTPEGRGRKDGVEYLLGDGFTHENMSKLKERLDALIADNHELDTIFFRPIAGLDSYVHLPEARRFLFNTMLRGLYERLAPGGRILIELSAFSQQHAGGYLDAFERMFKDGDKDRIPGVEFRRLRGSQGEPLDLFIIEKGKNAPDKLPSMKRLVMASGIR
jgi:hypothetical protein